MKKRILSIAMIVVMIFCMLPVESLAEVIDSVKNHEVNELGEEDEPNYFCITNISKSDGNVTWKRTGDPQAIELYYSYDKKDWTAITELTQSLSTQKIALKAGESLYFYNDSNEFSKDTSNFYNVKCDISYTVSGDITTLLSHDGGKLQLEKDYVFNQLFTGASYLASAEDLQLPSTVLSKSCYEQMFYNCKNLKIAPDLPAITLEEKCYNSMFAYCSSLEYVNASAVNSANAASAYWLDNVSKKGIFVLPEKSCMIIGSGSSSGVPTGWTKVMIKEMNGTVLVEKEGDKLKLTPIPSEYFKYKEGTLRVWYTSNQENLPITDNTIDIPDKDVYVYAQFESEEPTINANADYFCITNTEEEKATVTWTRIGNPNAVNIWYSLDDKKTWNSIPRLTYDDDHEEISLEPGKSIYFLNTTGKLSCDEHNYYNLNIDMSHTVSGDITTLLNENGNVTDLSEAGKGVFCNLLLGDYNLVSAKNLNLTSTKLTEICYGNMFKDCYCMEVAPNLPALTLAPSCYSEMFSGCSSIKDSPILPAVTLEKNVYANLFAFCENLSCITIMATDVSGDKCICEWVKVVASKGVIIKPKDTVFEKGDNGIPEGWLTINISSMENGTVEVTRDGDSFVLAPKPSAGYRLKAGSLKVTDAEGQNVSIMDNKFTMSDKDVTVDAEFMPVPLYSSDRNSLTVNDTVNNETATIILIAPGNLLYDGTEKTFAAFIGGDSALWQEIGIEIPEITYLYPDKTSKAEAPKEPGIYVAKITAEDGSTASVDIEIKKDEEKLKSYADSVIKLIEKIGTVSRDNYDSVELKNAIDAAKKAYDELNDWAKEYVTNYGKISDAQESIKSIKETVEKEEQAKKEAEEKAKKEAEERAKKEAEEKAKKEAEEKAKKEAEEQARKEAEEKENELANLKNEGALAKASVKGFKKKIKFDSSISMTQDNLKVYVKVKEGNKSKKVLLTSGTDYELKYWNNTMPGMVTLAIKGKGEYEGTKVLKYKIDKADLKKEYEKTVSVNMADSVVYVDKGAKPVPTVSFNGVALEPGKDYAISYKNNTYMKAKKKGNATITIKGKGNYTGKLTLKFNVTAGDITKLDVTVGDVKAGKNGYPKVTVLNESGKKLKAKNNYKVEFFTTDGTKVSKKDKFEAGTKLIAKITGTGNYEGEIVKEYMVK